jgi:hypothetical protein
MDDIKIIDNFLPKLQQREFLTLLNDASMAWSYHVNSDFNDDIKLNKWRRNDPLITKYDQFVTSLDDVKYAYWYEVFQQSIQKHLQVKVEKILRMRLCFGFPRPNLKTFGYGVPHIDMTIPQTTIVYYGNDADTKTVLFKEFYKDDYDYSKKTIETMVEPKQGRACVFDGLRYHSVQPFSETKRLILNINFLSYK